MLTTIIFASVLHIAQPASSNTQPAAATQWSVRATPGLDMALLVGPLSGDPLVLRRDMYTDERAWADRNLGPAAKRALRRVRRIVDDDQSHVTGYLALFFSAGPMKTLDDVVAQVAHPESQLERLEKDPNWAPEDTRRFRRLQNPLLTVLRAFVDLKLPALYKKWQAGAVARKVSALKTYLSDFDIIPLQEKLLGRKLDRTIEVLVLAYNDPYGIRITGQRFITHHGYSNELVLRNAVHEMFHPPFVRDNARLWTALTPLEKDPWMRSVVEDHDPAYGYRTFRGIVNEDSTRALDQLVSEQLGIARDMGRRVQHDDGGMHVLSAALYSLLKASGFASSGGRYEAWLIDAAERGMLSPENVKRHAAYVAGVQAVERWGRAHARTESTNVRR